MASGSHCAGPGMTPVGRHISPFRAERPARYLRAIVEAILPWDRFVLSEADQRSVLDESTAFVRGQINAMSAPLQLQVWVALLVFRAYAWVRCGGAICRLPLPRRRRLVDSWSYGPLYLPRQLFRMLRGITLLVYFEHPVVARALQGAPAGEKGSGSLRNVTVAREPSSRDAD